MGRKRVRGEKGLAPCSMRPATLLLTASILAAMMFVYTLCSSHTYLDAEPTNMEARPASWLRGLFALFGLVPFRDYVGSGQGALWESDAEGWRRQERVIDSRSGVTTFPATKETATKLLLASHNRLGWYDLQTEQFTVIHENQGVYYGCFPGEELDESGVPRTVWVVSRPHNWRPSTTSEWLLELDIDSGQELGRVQIDSRFTHDVVRRGDRVYVANTGEGKVLELAFPSMRPIRNLKLFTEQEHLNTLSPTGYGTMWAMLHNLGPVS